MNLRIVKKSMAEIYSELIMAAPWMFIAAGAGYQAAMKTWYIQIVPAVYFTLGIVLIAIKDSEVRR